MLYQNHWETAGGQKNEDEPLNTVYTCKYDLNNPHHFRAEKEKLNEKMKAGHQQEEVDDSGFYAGEITHQAVEKLACFLSWGL